MTFAKYAVGFTGTRHGFPFEGRQRRNLGRVLQRLQVTEIHLGDCLGADVQAYEVAVELCIKTIGHPPEDDSKRAFLRYDEERDPKPYLARNWNIVEASKILFTAPLDPANPITRSGTWSAIRYAWKNGTPVLFV